MRNTATFTDLYQLTMLQSYWREGMDDEAVFDLFIRRLKNRRYFVVCGIDQALDFLDDFSFTDEELEYLKSLDQFSDEFVSDYLADFEFTGDVYGVEEGTIMYPNEPILEVVGPIGEAQIVETFLLNQIGFQTNIATKASHVVEATDGEIVADFGMRRAQGIDAALKGSRAMYIGGVDATSNVAAGREYDIPVTGTMAHSYVEAHDSEVEAFREFAETYPSTIVLVDTYDTMRGVEKLVQLMNRTGILVDGVRLDSGDLAHLSKNVRSYLDRNGYQDVKIFGSDGLDEDEIERMNEKGAEFDGFGVGTKMATSADQPYADAVYKLCEYSGTPRMKLSSGKSNLPGKKQVYRVNNGISTKDLIACREEEPEQLMTPLLRKMVENGSKISEDTDLEDARSYVKYNKGVGTVNISDKLQEKADKTAEKLKSSEISV